MMGTPAARAWSMASTVWGMTPSSAATTSTAISVTLAPRARIEVKASWPGVSRKTMRRPSWMASLAPMRWVMPPRSPAATDDSRMRSRRLVLPWSTWPMTVTMGARSTSWSGASSSYRATLVAGAATASPSVSRASAGRFSETSKPSSAVTSAAVSRSMVWLMVAKMPLRMSSRMTSAELMPMSSASSLTVMESGISTAPRVGRVGDPDRAIAALGPLARLLGPPPSAGAAATTCHRCLPASSAEPGGRS